MKQMKTLKFPHEAEPREVVDAKAREDIEAIPSWAKEPSKPDYTWDEINDKPFTNGKINLECLPDDISSGDADTLDGLHATSFKQTWTTYAGEAFVGWVQLVKWPANSAGTLNIQPFIFNIYRAYNSPSPESYTLSIHVVHGKASITQLSGYYSGRIIEKFRISKSSDSAYYYLEMYVNTDSTAYKNTCYCCISNYYAFSGELVSTVSTEASPTVLCEITTRSGVGDLTTTGNITASTFTGSGAALTDLNAANISSGVLAATNGGTGQSALVDSANALINALESGTSAPTDDTCIITQGIGSNYSDKFYKRPASSLWNYIKSKADSTYATKADLTSAGGMKIASGSTSVINETTVTLGFKPKILFFSTGYIDYSYYDEDISFYDGFITPNVCFAFAAGSVYTSRPYSITFTSTGFTLNEYGLKFTYYAIG